MLKKFSKIISYFMITFLVASLFAGLNVNDSRAAIVDGLVCDYAVNQNFNGTSTYVDKTADLPSVSGLATGSIVVRFKSTSTAVAKTFISASHSADASSNMSFTLNNGNVYFENRENGTYATQLTAAGTYNDGALHTAVLTVNSTGTKIYVDGTQKVSGTSTKFFTNVTTLNNFNIGRNLDNKTSGEWYYNGDIDFIKVYNRALTTADIAELSQTAPVITNLAPAAAVTSSTPFRYVERINDGAKTDTNAWADSNGSQWIQLDLGKICSLTGVNAWHYWGDGRTYRDVVIRLSNVADFSSGVTTIFNNDTNNSLGLGTGTDAEYAETSAGKSITFNAVNARYVRLYSNGSTANTYNHYVEVEVLGDASQTAPVAPLNLAASTVSQSQLNISWNPAVGATGYDLLVDGVAVSNATSPYAHTGLAKASTHTYSVRAKNASGTSAWSTAVTGTTWADNVYKSNPVALFGPGMFNSNGYRIPALFTTQDGTIIAGIDQRIPGLADSPNDINAAIRRSTDGGKTWQNIQVVLDYPGNGYDAASVIDMTLLQDNTTGTIWMLIDHFPGGIGFNNAAVGTGFDSNGYKLLFDASNNQYTLRANGEVYNSSGIKSTYTVNSNGDVYNSGTYSGNIYFKTTVTPRSLLEARTCFLQVLKSDDDGLTWSAPIDLNHQVKAANMKFYGTGPGRGNQIMNGPNAGRLIFPTYYTSTANGLQLTSCIYSDDHGVTWYRGGTPSSSSSITEAAIVEYGTSGALRMFMRHGTNVYVSTSTDGGVTWTAAVATSLPDPYCQLSAINYPSLGDGKDRVIFVNPASTSGRVNGTVRISEDGGVTWKYSKVITPNGFAYSCLTVLPNNNIGLLYEDNGGGIQYTEFSLEWIMTR